MYDAEQQNKRTSVTGTETANGGCSQKNAGPRKRQGASRCSLLSDKVLAEGRAPNESALYACRPIGKHSKVQTLNGKCAPATKGETRGRRRKDDDHYIASAIGRDYQFRRGDDLGNQYSSLLGRREEKYP